MAVILRFSELAKGFAPFRYCFCFFYFVWGYKIKGNLIGTLPMRYSCCSGTAAPTRNEAKEPWLFRVRAGFPQIAGYTYMKAKLKCMYKLLFPYLMEYSAAKNSKMYYQNNGVLRHTSKRRNLFTLNRVTKRARTAAYTGRTLKEGYPVCAASQRASM